MRVLVWCVHLSLIASLQKTQKKDPIARLFARFCGILRPLPLQCLTTVLETLELGFRGGFSSVLLAVRAGVYSCAHAVALTDTRTHASFTARPQRC